MLLSPALQPQRQSPRYSGWTQLQGRVPSCQSRKHQGQVINILLHFLLSTTKEAVSQAVTVPFYPSNSGDFWHVECFLMVFTIFPSLTGKLLCAGFKKPLQNSSCTASPQKRRPKGQVGGTMFPSSGFFVEGVEVVHILGAWHPFRGAGAFSYPYKSGLWATGCPAVSSWPYSTPGKGMEVSDYESGISPAASSPVSSLPPSLSAPGFAPLPGRGSLGWAPQRWV